jgi:hypothetical protein
MKETGQLYIYIYIYIRGYAFHWGQAVWRKVQEVGLQVFFYKKDSPFLGFSQSDK